MPELKGRPVTRFLARAIVSARRTAILGVRGAEHVRNSSDPFIFVLNHSQRTEAIVVPALLSFLREGRLVHFLADWNFCLIPPVAVMYYCSGAILLTRKSAKPRFLNVFRPLFTRKVNGFNRARLEIESGQSVGVFPEGTVNRDPHTLLKGHSGAAWLSLVTGAPLVPAGLYYPGFTGTQPITEQARWEMRIGEPLHPGQRSNRPALADVRALHNRIMGAIAGLSGKQVFSGASNH